MEQQTKAHHTLQGLLDSTRETTSAEIAHLTAVTKVSHVLLNADFLVALLLCFSSLSLLPLLFTLFFSAGCAFLLMVVQCSSQTQYTLIQFLAGSLCRCC